MLPTPFYKYPVLKTPFHFLEVTNPFLNKKFGRPSFRYQFSKSSDWHLTILLIFIDGWFIYFRVDIYKYVLHDFLRLRSVKLITLGHWKLKVREKILFLLIQHIRGHDFFVFRDIQYTWEYDGARKTVNSTNCFIFKLCWPGAQRRVKHPRWCFWWRVNGWKPKLHLRCVRGFWTRLCNIPTDFITLISN